jgi:GT2 family glycosyltransferase
VVAVMVIHESGDWLIESLRSLVAQDYEGLQILLLVTGTSEGQAARNILDTIETHAPQAVVRFLGGNPGYGPSCNAVLDLVKGESGLFCFLHDDVALFPDAISQLVVEMYRSNAGVVGPKLVYWDDASMIQSVGSASDRFGVMVPYADTGERDQEQHDVVQDVFVVSSACMVVRADLFRAVGGFDATVGAAVNDLDFCWRVHASGARVVIVPAAIGRHRESMSRELHDNDVDEVTRTSEYDRVATVVSLSTARQLPAVLLQMGVLTVARAVLLLVTGRGRRAIDELMAFFSLPRSVTQVRSRRKAVQSYRSVEGGGIGALQVRGSSHVTVFFRRRARLAGIAQSQASKDVIEAAPKGSYVLWAVLVGVLLVGSRALFLDGVVPVGQMVPFHESVRSTIASYASGWWGAGFGQVSALPTGVALSAVSTAVVFGQSGLAHTLAVVLLPLVGWLGVWRFASVFGTRAARIGAVTAYAAVPLPYVAISSGRWGALLVYGCLPWMIHLLRMLVGHADVSEARLGEHMVVVSSQVWRQWFASLVLLVAIVFAFEPSIVGVLPFTAVVLSVAMWVQGLNIKWLARWLGITALATFVGVALNLPWSISYLRDGWWEAIFGAPVESGRQLGLWNLLTFDLGEFWLSFGVVGLYAAVIGAVLLVRGVRTQWALRGATLVAAGVLLAIADDAGLLPLHMAEPGIMLVPVALGLAVCAGAMGASLASDLGRGRLSWRQPFGALVGVVFAVGLLPTSINSLQGSWHQPSLTLPQLLAQLPGDSADGEYRTLFIGDSRVLPGAPLGFGWGISYSVLNGSVATVDEHWEIPETKVRENANAALYGIVRGQTSRAGRLLAPLAVRFIVVPVIDGAQSRRDAPIAAPLGLVESLSRQLDLKRRFASPDVVVFENSSWLPVRSMLTEVGSQSSQLAGAKSMIAADISGATPLPAAEYFDSTVRAPVEPGTFHLAVPFTPQWKVSVDGREFSSRPAFGLTNGYDIDTPGIVTISFATSILHSFLVVIQFAAWSVVVFIALSRRRRRILRRDTAVVFDAPAISLNDEATK